jgi:hypothetical protein
LHNNDENTPFYENFSVRKAWTKHQNSRRIWSVLAGVLFTETSMLKERIFDARGSVIRGRYWEGDKQISWVLNL